MSHPSDEELLDELRHIVKRIGKTPSRNRVMKTFTVGTGRAARLLQQLEAGNTNGHAKQDELPLVAPAPVVRDVFGQLIERCAKAAFKAERQVDFNAPVADRYQAIARAVLSEAMQERG